MWCNKKPYLFQDIRVVRLVPIKNFSVCKCTHVSIFFTSEFTKIVSLEHISLVTKFVQFIWPTKVYSASEYKVTFHKDV